MTTTPLPEPVARVILAHQPLRSNEHGSWQLPPQLEALILHKVDNGDSLYTADQLQAYSAAECAARDAEIERLRADASKLEVQRDDARFAYRKLKEHIQGDCV